MMGKTIVLIPARAGSKGVPNKNIRPLGGYPLIQWSIAACVRTKTIDQVVVSTDSEEYANLCRTFGAQVPFLRPAEISQDYSTDLEFILHALDWFSTHDTEPELIVHIRPTTPLRDPRLIDAAVATFRSVPHATALRSVHEMSESSYKTFELAPDGQLMRVGSGSTELDVANNARQQFPKTYAANGYVDVLSVAFIRRRGLLHGDWVLPFVTPPVVEVDTMDDFVHLEYQLSRHPSIAVQIFS